MIHNAMQSEVDRVNGVWFEGTLLPAIFWTLLWGYAVFTLLALFGATLGEFDDAIPLLHGVLVQQGRTPNLDFYSFYPPLNAYVNAGAFALLGRTVLAARVVTAILYVAVLLLAMRVLRSRLMPVAVLLPAALLLLATSMGAAISLPVFPGFALALSVLLLYLGAPNDRAKGLPAVSVSGALAGVALMYRVNFGLYAIAVIALDLLVPDGVESLRLQLKLNLKKAVAFFVPLVGCSVVLCLWIYGKSSGVAVSQFIVTAQKVMASFRFIALRFSTDVACAVVLPCGWFFFRALKNTDRFPPKAFLAAALAMCLLLLTLVSGGSARFVPVIIIFELLSVGFLHLFVHRLERSELSVLFFFCCVLHYFLSRADWMHWRLLPICAALLLIFAVVGHEEARLPGFGWRSSKTTAFALIAAASFVMVATEAFRPAVSHAKSGAGLLVRLIRNPHLSDAKEVLDAAIPASGWSTVYPDHDELAALRYLRARTSDSDPIFVGVQDHSRLFWNDLRVYWLAGRPIGVHTFQLETRVATEATVQREIIRDLQQNGVRWIILNSASVRGDDTFLQRAYHGSTLLDEYIAKNFHQQARFGVYAVLSRSEA